MQRDHPVSSLKNLRSYANVRLLLISILVSFLLSILFGACVVGPGQPTIPFIPLERSATPPIQPGSSPTTQTVPAALTPTTAPEAATTSSSANSATASPEAILTATGNSDFSEVKLSFGGFLSDYRYFVAFTFPEPVQGEYYALVDENKTYDCQVRTEYPNRLYCSGPLVASNNWAQIDLYQGDNRQPVWSGQFFVPLLDE